MNADIRYWPAFGDEDYQSSGAYIFRVANGTSQSLRYSQFQGMTVFNGGFVNQVSLNYFNSKNETAKLILRTYNTR